MNLQPGDRVRIAPECPWGSWAFGTVTPPTPLHLAIARPGEWQGGRKTIQTSIGPIAFYYIEFDSPQGHTRGGAFSGAEIEVRFLMPVRAQGA